MLEIKTNTDAVLKLLEELPRNQIPFATALALTRTAQKVHEEIKRKLPSIYDRPTPWTVGGMYVKPARKNALSASVKFKDRSEATKGLPAAEYLQPSVYGVARKPKAFERLLQRAGVLPSGWYAVPSKHVALDSYGNVPRGTVTKILSQLQASRDSAQNERASVRRKRNRRQMYGRYFLAYPSREITRHLTPGIYERIGGGMAVRPVFLFVDKPPVYRQQFRFFVEAETIARRIQPDMFREAIAETMATMQKA